jgi:hypothetical protein
MSKSLLEQAKEVPVLRERHEPLRATDEELELVLALIRGEIRPRQFRQVIKTSGGSEMNTAYRILRWAILRGKLVEAE